MQQAAAAHLRLRPRPDVVCDLLPLAVVQLDRLQEQPVFLLRPGRHAVLFWYHDTPSRRGIFNSIDEATVGYSHH